MIKKMEMMSLDQAHSAIGTGNDMSKAKKIKYTDYSGKALPEHDGTCIRINQENGTQFFGLDGKGFFHDGAPISLPDGKKQFFLYNGKAIIHDGTPYKLPDGRTQLFDETGMAMWPVDMEHVVSNHNEQREVFFKEMVKKINQDSPLTQAEIEDLRLALLAADHTDNEDSKNIIWIEDLHKTGLKPISEGTSHALMVLEVIWPRVWNKYQLRHKETLSARFVLHLEKKNKCELAGLRSAESMLVNELNLEFIKAEKFISPPDSSQWNLDNFSNYKTNSKGIFELDEHLLNYVKKMRKGKGTEIFLSEFRKAYKAKDFDISDRINCWRSPLFMYRCIAEIVWFNTVRQMADGVYRKPPALPLIVSDTINEIVKIGTKYDEKTGRIISKTGKEIATIDNNDLSHIPALSMKALQRILHPNNTKALTSLNYFRLVSWEVITGLSQIVKNQSDPRLISVSGGYEEVAHLIGAGKGGYARDQVRDILAWQAAPQKYVLHDRYGNEKVVVEGNMISFERIEGGSKSSALNIILGTMLLPHSFFKLLKPYSKSLSSEATMLIPLPNREPNLIGKPNTFASQISFQWNFLAEIRKRAKELVKNGCIYMPSNKMVELAQKSSLNTPFHLRVIDAWLQNGDNPAFLHLVEKDHYALGPDSKQLQDFIIEGGKRELALSEAGKKSVRKKAVGVFSKSKTN
jgi:hypothetical protein